MINVIGLGYIGLPTALMLACQGIEVVGTDCKKEVVDRLNSGNTTFKERGLDEIFRKAVSKGIVFTTGYQPTDMYIVSVPTPYDKDTKKIDAQFVVAAIESVLKVCLKETTIVIESTISPGTTDRVIRPLIQSHGFTIGEDIHIVHAPERIIPGNMVYELIHNDRTIGADSRYVGEKVKNYYASFCEGEIDVTDIRTAEMTKVVENTYRAVNIAFANELSRICSRDGMDVYEVIRLCNKHPRVNILQPGPGVGGHCISVDPWFIVGDYPELSNVIRESLNTNVTQPLFVLRRIREIMNENGVSDSSRVGLYGLTFKENVDDFRDSPTLQLLKYVADMPEKNMKSYDPFLENHMIVENQYSSFDDFIDGTDMVVVMVKHDHIRRRQERLRNKIVLDCFNIFPLDGIYHL